MCDDHLISAALSEMAFRRGIALIALEVSALSRGVMPSDAFTANQALVINHEKERFMEIEDGIHIVQVCYELLWGAGETQAAQADVFTGEIAWASGLLMDCFVSFKTN